MRVLGSLRSIELWSVAAAIALGLAAPPRSAAQTAAPQDAAVKAEVAKFVNSYFDAWSKQDMDAYDACFLEEAVIQYVDAAGRMTSQEKRPFVAGQRAFHKRSKSRTVEYPVSMDVRLERSVARAVVYWKLQSDGREEYGYDHFTLIKARNGWRIANLLFYSTPKE